VVGDREPAVRLIKSGISLPVPGSPGPDRDWGQALGHRRFVTREGDFDRASSAPRIST